MTDRTYDDTANTQQVSDTSQLVSAQKTGSENAVIATPATAPAIGTTAPGKRRRGGAPQSNRNAYRHGLRSRLGAETDPETTKAVGTFRKALEDATVARYGEVTPRASGMIYAAMQAARIAMNEQRELDNNGSAWEPEQRTGKRQSILKSLAEMTRYLRDLGLPLGPTEDADLPSLDLPVLHIEPESPAASTSPAADTTV